MNLYLKIIKKNKGSIISTKIEDTLKEDYIQVELYSTGDKDYWDTHASCVIYPLCYVASSIIVIALWI